MHTKWKPNDIFVYPGGLVGRVVLDLGHRLYTVAWQDKNGEDSGIRGVVPAQYMKPCADNVIPLHHPLIGIELCRDDIKRIHSKHPMLKYRQSCVDASRLNR